MAESQKVERCELLHSSSLLDDAFSEESPQRTKLLSNASSSRGSMSSVSDQQDDGKRNKARCHLFVCVPYM